GHPDVADRLVDVGLGQTALAAEVLERRRQAIGEAVEHQTRLTGGPARPDAPPQPQAARTASSITSTAADVALPLRGRTCSRSRACPAYVPTSALRISKPVLAIAYPRSASSPDRSAQRTSRTTPPPVAPGDTSTSGGSR